MVRPLFLLAALLLVASAWAQDPSSPLPTPPNLPMHVVPVRPLPPGPLGMAPSPTPTPTAQQQQ